MLKTRKKVYGTTWWGQIWIEALERIDSNRLARGKTYANTGRVLNISVNQGKVTAKVKGSYYDSYEIEIKAEPFTKQDIKAIKSIVAQHPSLTIELSTGTLPSVLLELMDEAGIQLLPRRWRDLKSRCSCPDGANPCKHLAAVYYILANEIDKDPFVLFNLKGLSVQDLVGSLTLNPVAKPSETNPILTRLISPDRIVPTKQEPTLESLTFSFQNRDVRPLLSLLADNPPFYLGGNFKDFLENLYRTVPGEIDRLFSTVNEGPLLSSYSFQFEFLKDEYVQRHLFKAKIAVEEKNIKQEKECIRKELNSQDRSKKPRLPVDSLKLGEDRICLLEMAPKSSRWKAVERFALGITELEPILDYFLSTSLFVDRDEASDSFVFLNVLASMALGLVRARLFLPEVLYESDKAFCIRYVPSIQEPVVHEAVEKLKVFMPRDICRSGEHFLSAEGISDLLALFITHLVHKAVKHQPLPENDRIINLFSQDYLFRASKLTEKSIEPSISNWLDKLHLGKRDIAPVIRIEPAKADQFNLFVDIINRQGAMDLIQPFHMLFELPKSKKKPLEIFSKPVDEVRADVSKQLIIAGQYMRELKTIVDSQGKKVPLIPLSRMSDMLLSTAGILEVMGINLILPKELKKLAYPNLYAKAKFRKSNETGANYLSLDDLLDFSYEIALGEEIVSPHAFRKLVKETGGLVKFKDQYLLLKPDEVQNILAKLKEPFPELSSPMQALYTAVSGEVNGIRFQPDQALNNLLSGLTQMKEVPVPDNLNATLRPYQERGFQWLWSNAQKGFGSCIADDMGLGKTVQVISLLLQTKSESEHQVTSLVICPTTLIGNWEKECQKFAPDLKLNIYHGTERQLNLKGVDLVITSYGTLRQDFQKFNAKPWHFLIIDEAQNIKNADTAQTRAIKSLKGNIRIAMTGTPVENRLTELWNIFDFVNHGYLGSLSCFKKELANPIEKYRDPEVVEKLKRVTAPFILRRLKTDKTIISDLPDKITFDEYCYLTKEQAAVYQNVVETTMREIETSEGIQRKGLIFKLITALKQICNHPAHFANRGSVASEHSGKATKTLATVQTILDNKEKALIFTQYREMGNLLQQMIQDELGEEPLFFHGGILRKKRDEMVQTFQTDRKARLMIISLKAGGTGLNLTEASNVIHYDLWWNPAVENQATDRAYRIGQEKKVIVHRLITLGTFEEKIDEMIKSKQALADLTVSTGEHWITEMSNKDLREIFTIFHS